MAEEKTKKPLIDFYGKVYKIIPGGMMIVPMLIFAVLNTFFPNLLPTMGGVSQATFKTGTLTLVGMIMFGTGASITLDTVGEVVRRSGALAIVKLIIDFAFGILYVRLFGMDGIFGINAVAFVTVICSCNPGVFAGIIGDYGEPADMGNFVTMNVLSMPAFPIMVLAASAGSGFDWMQVITIIVPFILGMIMGNLDPGVRKVYSTITPVVLPFMGACFGSSLNLIAAVKAGLAGILLTILFMVINAVIMVATDKFINKRPGYAAAAMCSVAGIAMSIAAFLDPEQFGPYLETATAQIAFAVILTAILSPLLTKWVVSLWGSPKSPKKEIPAETTEPAQS